MYHGGDQFASPYGKSGGRFSRCHFRTEATGPTLSYQFRTVIVVQYHTVAFSEFLYRDNLR